MVEPTGGADDEPHPPTQYPDLIREYKWTFCDQREAADMEMTAVQSPGCFEVALFTCISDALIA